MTRNTSAVGTLESLTWRGWVVFHDMVLPGRRGGELDFVLVGPGGVFVVQRRKWPGPAEVVDGELHLGGRARPHDVTDVAEAATEVLALVPDVPVHPVLCLERHAPVTGWVRNVMLCATSNVEEVLTSRPPVLGPEQVAQVGGVLTSRLRPAPPPPPEEPANGVVPWPIRILVQAATLALAALMVIGVLRTGVVDEVSTAVAKFVSEVGTGAESPAPRSSPQVQPRERTAPGQGEQRPQIRVKGRQIQIDKRQQRRLGAKDEARDKKRDRRRNDRDRPRG